MTLYRETNYGMPFYIPYIFPQIWFLCYNYFIVIFLLAFAMIFNSCSLIFPSRLASNRVALSAQFCSFYFLIVFNLLCLRLWRRWVDLPTPIYYICYLLSCLCCCLLMMLFCWQLTLLNYSNYFPFSLHFALPTLLLLIKIKLKCLLLVVYLLTFVRDPPICLELSSLSVFLVLSTWVCNLTI